MVEVKASQANVVVKRELAMLVADKENERLEVVYVEKTFIDEELVHSRKKPYTRDYLTWEAHEIGQEIMAMINADLTKEDPQVQGDDSEEG